MAKDPAFLFYSKDFYEGTRMMLPEERACYVDLLIYQHQNGMIPNDIKRLSMYCSGVDEATLITTLEAKFKKNGNGWLNEKLQDVILDRAEFKTKLSISGTIGQFWKKCKAILDDFEYKKLRNHLKNVDKNEIYEFIKDKEINETSLKGWLEALVKHIAIANANEDIIIDTIINNRFYEILLNSESWLESISIKHKSNVSFIKAKLTEFNNELFLRGDQKSNKNEYQSHFVSWLNKNHKQELTSKQVF